MRDPDPLPADARRQIGQDLRRRLPRGAHAAWAPPSGRRAPVATLIDADRTRIAELLPVRYSRMSTNAFAFLRGAAAVMAADLASLPHTGLRAQSCGDCHVMNFGAYASPEGTPVFDINDFDETLPAPFEWDLKRLAASLAVAGRANGLPDKAARALARRSAHAYRQHMHELAAAAPVDAWRSRIALDAAIDGIGDRAVRRRERQRLQQAVDVTRDPYRHLVGAADRLHLPQRPPAIYRLGRHEHTAHTAFAAYVDTLAEERRVLVQRYRLRDVAFKAVGVGSVGTFCAIGLFADADGHRLLLQLKQAGPSVLAPYAGDSAYANQGQRVAVGQRMMQAATDVFLSWAEDPVTSRDFYVRQLKDARLAAIGTRIEADALPFYARLCGRTLARAHARSGDAPAIAGYLGNGDAFDAALAAFAIAYADQTEQDFRDFQAAIQSGRIEAREETTSR
ncbi:DUF2252 domain-containing protein [Limobrevibacterium gyesilva]|uniref:DUF2252 domain-containing protein n=1 Tax=Limobrevibacterium gyesilva TaxID=2991712 RepID=A0AA41YS16_9PROT|nr:DUF2252 domain-containing protein [Limobrevibacterium gyesilva]MCW3475465.1 DUF2252 domain-containing protein [Limobrevibacterium gyesilva]